MELLALPQNPTIEIVEDSKIVNSSKTRFIEANTLQVSLSHLKEDCIIPVFAKDNETTLVIIRLSIQYKRFYMKS